MLELDVLRTRRTMKWSRYPPDVLPTWVAEMDFPLAPKIRDAACDVLAAAQPRHLTGLVA